MAKCETCPKTFATQEACKQHMAEMGHRKPKKKCDRCNKLFQDRRAAEAHMDDKNHYKDYCKPCDKRFPNENELKMHFNSKAHRRTQKPDSGNVENLIRTQSNIEDFSSNGEKITSLNLKRAISGATTNEESPEPSDYTVGWVCALPTEMAAAEGMLEKVYPAPSQHRLDENNYVLGQIAHLKIVVVCLPSGFLGTTPAAVAAGQMRQTFPALKHFLLVGIGGGMPSKNSDVRLGDVVISQKVIQYDFGKAVPGNNLVLTGHLNRPPAILLNAASRLESQEVTGSPELVSSVLGHLARMQAKYPDSEYNWSYPGVEKDQLFNSDYVHDRKNPTCVECDPARLQLRLPRVKTRPKFHYGTIASANRVMRDGTARERLRKETDALCVEMEAAGLMDNFPCLVVRGICDYADSHKNKDWQLHAAAIAAAYAKELLSIIPKHT